MRKTTHEGNCDGDVSKKLRNSGRLQWVRSVFSRFLTAQPGTRKHLIGVGDVLRIEAAAHALHGIQVRLGIHIPHRVLLFPPHAMFSGDGTSVVHAQIQDAHRKVDGNVLLPWNRPGHTAPADAGCHPLRGTRSKPAAPLPRPSLQSLPAPPAIWYGGSRHPGRCNRVKAVLLQQTLPYGPSTPAAAPARFAPAGPPTRHSQGTKPAPAASAGPLLP